MINRSFFVYIIYVHTTNGIYIGKLINVTLKAQNNSKKNFNFRKLSLLGNC